MRRTECKVGLSRPFGDDSLDTRLPAPLRRSRQPSRDRRIHLKTKFALTPFARATPATEAPGRPEPRPRSAAVPPRSATAASHPRPRRRRQPHFLSIPRASSSSGVHQIPGGHLTDPNRIPKGGRRITLTALLRPHPELKSRPSLGRHPPSPIFKTDSEDGLERVRVEFVATPKGDRIIDKVDALWDKSIPTRPGQRLDDGEGR